MGKEELTEINQFTEQLLEKLCSPYATNMHKVMDVGYFDRTNVNSLKPIDFGLKSTDGFQDKYEYAIQILRASDLIEYSEENGQKWMKGTPNSYKVYLSGGWIKYISQLDKEAEDRRALLDLQRRYFKLPLIFAGAAFVISLITLIDRLFC